jgi:hypothetical protein
MGPVARCAETEHEQRFLAGFVADRREPLTRHDGTRGARGGDDDIGRGEAGVEFVPVAWLAAELGGNFLGAGEAAIADEQASDPFVVEIAKRFLGHLAGADDEDGLIAEAVEDAAAELAHGDTGDRHAAFGELRLGADAARNLEGALEQHVGERAISLGACGHVVGGLHLVHDLIFAEDHAVDTAGDLKQVLHCGGPALLQQLAEEVLDGDVVELGEELRHLHGRRRGAVVG